MKNYKVKLTILDENDEIKISSTITTKLIHEMKRFHNLSALDEQLEILLGNLD